MGVNVCVHELVLNSYHIYIYIYMFCMHVLKFPWSRYSLAHGVVGCRDHDGRWECPSRISIFLLYVYT